MKIVIFGASGSLGKIILQQAIEQGLLVTAFTRKAENLASFQAYNLQVVEGNVLSKDDVVKAVQGRDAVVCNLWSSSAFFNSQPNMIFFQKKLRLFQVSPMPSVVWQISRLQP